MACITALAFICAVFIPTVHSQLGMMSSNQSHQKTTTKDTINENENLYVKRYIELNSKTVKSINPSPLNRNPPNVHLPTTQVTMTVFSSTSSYFRTQLTNVPPGYEVSNRNYTGWCSDNIHYISYNTLYQVTLYSSYYTPLPAHLYHQNWSKVNYILNHKVGSDWQQVQNAIYYILDFGDLGLNTNGWAMVNNASLYGGSFVPGGGDIIAIIADAGLSIQRTIFELVVPTYTLSISINGNGAVIKNPNQASYTYGQVVQLTANPSAGWYFSSWGGNLSGSTNPTTITMTSNKSVTATFNQWVYSLAITVEPVAGGSVTAVPSPPYHYNDVVTLSATANPGYSFDHWGGDLSGSANPTTITMNGNKSVIANFSLIHYTLTITLQGQGTVAKNPNQPWYTYGQVVQLTANPSTGWLFDHWGGDLSGSTNPTSITMNGNKSVIANFSAIHYMLTITTQGQGTVTKNPNQAWYIYGQVVTLTATPLTGWVFNHWGGNLSGNTNPTTITMNGNKSVIANFTILLGYVLTITIQGSGNVTKVPNLPSYSYGQVVTLTAIPSTGWVFNHWGGNLSGNTNPTTITMNGHKTVIANFSAIHYTLAVTIEGSGTVTKSPDQPWYTYGQVVTVTATPSTGWKFDHWEGDLSGNTNPNTITMTGNKSVIANFTQEHYTLTILTEGQGTVTKDPNQSTYTYGTIVELTAVPDPNWKFSFWSGDLNGNENPDTITMTSNKSVTAHFIPTGNDTIPPIVQIVKPANNVYIFNKLIIPFKMPVVVQMITIEVNASDNGSGINSVEFFIDGVSKSNDSSEPYSYDWRDLQSGKHTIKVKAYDKAGNSATSPELLVFKWRFHPILVMILLFFGVLWRIYA